MLIDILSGSGSVSSYIVKAMWLLNLKTMLTLISSAEYIQLHISE